MPKIAMIGAGSQIFCKTLTTDILATPALQNSEICLMSRTRPKLDRMHRFIQRMIDENGLGAKVWSTLDRKEALKDADYVVVMFQVGGVDAFQVDYEVPLKFGVDQCIADTLGPGGVMRAQRHIPVLVEMAKEMKELCPNAMLLNYANPMAMCCMALGRVLENGQFIGLCHGVQTTLDLIAGYTGVPKDDIDFLSAGINHMGWFLHLRDKRDGTDLYPKFRELCDKPGFYVNEKVRIEAMRQFGYFMTESTGHLSEYLPWFRKNQKELDLFCDEPSFGGETGAYYKYCRMIDDKYKDVDYLEFESTDISQRSVEYCSYIMEAKETDKPFRLQGNVRNDGYITNLPDGSCVEVPCLVDVRGLHPLRVGRLPSQLAALNQSNISVQTLAVDAAMSGDPEHVVHAMAIDPLTASVLSLHEIREMAGEMIEAQRSWLPQFEGKKLRSTPLIDVPKNVERAEVPLDPALAIANRFGKLATQNTEG